MSGIEILGVIAGTLQLAEIGAKLSVKLCLFYREIKDANQSMQSLSSHMSLTSNILHELGITLQQDEHVKNCSEQMILSAQDVLDECKTVFKHIEETIEKQKPGDEKGFLQRGIRKITVALLERDLDVLKSALERLKSTMLLMLQVLMYAAQLRRRTEFHVLENQQLLIQTLLEEKKGSEARSNRSGELARPAELFDYNDALQLHASATKPEGSLVSHPLVSNELNKYYTFIKQVLRQIDAYRLDFSDDRFFRVRNGILNVHFTEVELLQSHYGNKAIEVFKDSIFELQNDHSTNPYDSKQARHNPSDPFASSAIGFTPITEADRVNNPEPGGKLPCPIEDVPTRCSSPIVKVESYSRGNSSTWECSFPSTSGVSDQYHGEDIGDYEQPDKIADQLVNDSWENLVLYWTTLTIHEIHPPVQSNIM
ncbi:hypothetical protein P170DRAFT_402612 [Aspergillus steynii IBT 23096]|uniref:Fungal N-terminal domain-containing protein n=1 Tax=Aspergillus steynii IBT 23096 TaxID=1392250 RepID=A0A2I2GHS0_9EURO|nr:uncharacterized protein P170DRAFT_402612 [Aspergillus steynii IBT 23096]PLB52431.1 hypothetical protein P170DRAFT_402612 [Aspergillus steynii IBT 23096]